MVPNVHIVDKLIHSVYHAVMVHKNHEMNAYCTLPQMWALFAVSIGDSKQLVFSRDFCME